MKFDHAVVHIDNDASQLAHIKLAFESVGLSYDPRRGEGTSGFKSNRVWLGREYIEVVRVTSKSGDGWKKEWTEAYHAGVRGATCLFFETDDLAGVVSHLAQEGISAPIQSAGYRKCMGLLSEKFPWSYVLTPVIPNSNIQIGFMQYDIGTQEKFVKKHNCTEQAAGPKMVRNIEVTLSGLESSVPKIEKIFEHLVKTNKGWCVDLHPRVTLRFTEGAKEAVKLSTVVSKPQWQSRSGAILNLAIENIS